MEQSTHFESNLNRSQRRLRSPGLVPNQGSRWWFIGNYRRGHVVGNISILSHIAINLSIMFRCSL